MSSPTRFHQGLAALPRSLTEKQPSTPINTGWHYRAGRPNAYDGSLYN